MTGRNAKQMKMLKQLAEDPMGADELWTSAQATRIVTGVFSDILSAAVAKGLNYADAATCASAAVQELIADATESSGFKDNSMTDVKDARSSTPECGRWRSNCTLTLAARMKT